MLFCMVITPSRSELFLREGWQREREGPSRQETADDEGLGSGRAGRTWGRWAALYRWAAARRIPAA